jgi:hypothetical protein
MFAFVPDNAPPRILRFVGPEHFAAPSIVCQLDEASNLLIINRALYDRLSEIDQHQVVRTCADVLYSELPEAA